MINKKLKDLIFTVIDVETTGLSPANSRIIEIGAVKIENLKIREAFRTFINPGRLIPYSITQLTGIEFSDVENAPYFEDAAFEFTNFIDDSVLVGHNFQFDFSFLKNELKAAGYDAPDNYRICTLKISRKLFPELKSKSLDSMRKHFNIRHGNVHRALADALLTAKIFLKIIKTLDEKHPIHTLSELLNYQSMPISNYSAGKECRFVNYDKFPSNPGVYFFTNENKILYIGKAKRLRDRIRSYFGNSAEKRSKRIIKNISGINYFETPTELTALFAESEMIKSLNPKYNKQLKKFGKNYFIKVDRINLFSKINVVDDINLDGADYFGPFNNLSSAKILLEIINKSLMLRKCDYNEFKKKQKCFFSEIEMCMAPCVNSEIAQKYEKELKKIYHIFAGKTDKLIEELVHKMKIRSEALRFDEAAEIRDIITLLLKQTYKTSLLAEPINSAKILLTAFGRYVNDYVLFISGEVFIYNYLGKRNNEFETAIDDYFNKTEFRRNKNEYEDLEKIRIAMNWLLKNSKSYSIHYLKDFNNKEELFRKVRTFSPETTEYIIKSINLSSLSHNSGGIS